MRNKDDADCATFPLHQIGAIQPYGYLLAIDDENVCVFCSENFLENFGLRADQVLNTELTDCLASAGLHTDFVIVEREFEFQTYTRVLLSDGKETYTGDFHSAGQYRLLEFEADSASSSDSHGHSKKAKFVSDIDIVSHIAHLADLESENESAVKLLEIVAKETGFDRCLIYRFLPNGQGEVVAERLNADVKSYLHHRFPGGDIPQNARTQYVQNPTRLIPDIDAQASAIIGLEEGASIDLTRSRFRAVHPVHLTYLSNMQVAASFSLTLVVNNELWGLVACHHETPKQLPLSLIRRLEECLSVTSLHIQHLQKRRIDRESQLAKTMLSNLRNMYDISSSSELEAAVSAELLPLMERLMLDACIIELAGMSLRIGAVPPENALASLQNWIAESGQDHIVFDHLPVSLHANKELKSLASGFIRMPLCDDGYLMFFRKEQREKLTWAGELPSLHDQIDRLSPRSSFESWIEETAYCSRPWFIYELAGIDVIQLELQDWIQSKSYADLALKDSLTGLANRARFEYHLKSLTDGDESPTCLDLALYFFDLDGFKGVNDTHGHQVGDELLKVIAQRLSGNLRKSDLLARLGGDEFVIAQIGKIPEATIQRTKHQIRHAICSPITIDNVVLEVGVSIGVASYPQDGECFDSLINAADERMYAEKKAKADRS